MSDFTPWTALAGGALIGLAAVMLLWWNGRVAGVSGIAGGLWFGAAGDRLWRGLFLLGLMAGAGAWVALGGPTPRPRPRFPTGLLVLAGLLVGYGTSLAGGCTSGLAGVRQSGSAVVRARHVRRRWPAALAAAAPRGSPDGVNHGLAHRPRASSDARAPTKAVRAPTAVETRLRR